MNEAQVIERPRTHASPLRRKLDLLTSLTDEDRNFLEKLENGGTTYRAGTQYIFDGQALSKIHVIRSGWTMCYSELDDGRRQILTFALPGDIVGLHASIRRRATFNASAITRSQITSMEAPGSGSLYAAHPRLGEAFSRSMAQDALLLNNQAMRLGRMTAYERVCHLIVELWYRLDAVGLIEDGRMPFPLTQSVISDALGLSLVHVNRQFVQLRREGSIRLDRRQLSILDFEKVCAAAHYNPDHYESIRR